MSLGSGVQRIASSLGAVSSELRWAWKCCERKSFARYGADAIAYRYMRLRQPRRYDERRCVRLKNGVQLVYRLNRADIHTLREVFVNEIYRLPFELPGSGGTLVDLGGNIGLASIYLARRHSFDRVVIVEPVAENAALARLNCAVNGIEAEIVQAAIAPRAGQVTFALADQYNQGHTDNGGSEGIVVEATTMPEVVGPSGPIRLVKMDIEGDEGPLLTEETEWLERVMAVIAEFHPAVVDCSALADVLKRRGFAFFPPGSVEWWSTDSFLRTPARAG